MRVSLHFVHLLSVVVEFLFGIWFLFCCGLLHYLPAFCVHAQNIHETVNFDFTTVTASLVERLQKIVVVRFTTRKFYLLCLLSRWQCISQYVSYTARTSRNICLKCLLQLLFVFAIRFALCACCPPFICLRIQRSLANIIIQGWSKCIDISIVRMQHLPVQPSVTSR